MLMAYPSLVRGCIGLSKQLLTQASSKEIRCALVIAVLQVRKPREIIGIFTEISRFCYGGKGVVGARFSQAGKSIFQADLPSRIRSRAFWQG